MLLDGVDELLRHFTPVHTGVNMMNYVVPIVEGLLVVLGSNTVVGQGVVALGL